MGGWKTWAAAVGSVAYGVGGYISGMHDATIMVQMVLAGLALIGVGHKIEKGPIERARTQWDL